MFNLHSINQHLADLKFDLASQALASSQTLIRSFRNLVNSIVTKIINEDALIKGQTNGPENFKVKITDTCLDLTNIKNEYSKYLKMASQQTVIPIIMPGNELEVDETELIANTRFSARLANCAGVMHKAEMISFIRQPGLARPVLDDNYGINAFPECIFVPAITNSYNPSYTQMFPPDQVHDIGYMTTQSFFRPLNSTGFTRPIWFSIKPIVLSSPNLSGTLRDNVTMSAVDKLTDDTFEALNCYYCQAVEYQTNGGSAYTALHSTMILYTMVQGRFDDIEHPTFARIAYKWYKDSLSGKPTNYSTVPYYERRHAVNGICEGKTDFDGYEIADISDFSFSLGSGFYSYSSDKILRLFTNLCQGEGPSRSFFQLDPTVIADPPDVDALYNDGQLAITKTLTRTDDGYTINDIHVSMDAFMGNLSSVMQDLIDDLQSADYE